MASTDRSVPAHHGTRTEWAETIEAEGFRPACDGQDYLGDGSYFFEDAPQLAEEWAQLVHPGHDTCVLEAEITLGRCLDLLDGTGQDLLEPFYQQYIDLNGAQMVSELKQNESQAYGDFDCGVINLAWLWLAEEGSPFDVVRARCDPFEAGALYEDSNSELPSSRFGKREHVQLAVRDNCAILGFKRAEPQTGKKDHGAR